MLRMQEVDCIQGLGMGQGVEDRARTQVALYQVHFGFIREF